jgi:hypothetical protein
MVTTQYLCDVCKNPFQSEAMAKSHEGLPIVDNNLYEGYTFRYGPNYNDAIQVGVILSPHGLTSEHVRKYDICTVNNAFLTSDYNPHWIEQFTMTGSAPINLLSNEEFEPMKDRLEHWIERHCASQGLKGYLAPYLFLSNRIILPSRL